MLSEKNVALLACVVACVGCTNTVGLGSAEDGGVAAMDSAIDMGDAASGDATSGDASRSFEFIEISESALTNVSALDYAVGPGDVHHFIYVKASDLRYTRWDESGAHDELVRSDVGLLEQVSMVLDASGNPHVALVDQNRTLLYATKSGAAWGIEPATSVGEALPSSGASIAVRSDGAEVVTFRMNATHEAALATRFNFGDTWELRPLGDAASPSPQVPVLEFDAVSDLHVGSLSANGQELRHQRFDLLTEPFAWNSVTTISDPFEVALSVSSTGDPFFFVKAEVSALESMLSVFKYSSGEWELSTFPTAGPTLCTGFDMERAPSGGVGLTWSQEEFWYAEQDPSIDRVVVAHPVSPATTIRLHYDAAGRPRIAYLEGGIVHLVGTF